MAVNPQLDSVGRPVPFINEMMALARDGVELQVDGLAECPGGKWSARGTLFLSSMRIVFVANQPRPPIVAFDMPLLFVREEKFNQPIFACNNLSGKVLRVLPEGIDTSSVEPYSFKFLFKEGGVGTFVPVFFNLLSSLRALSAVHTPTPSYSDDAQSRLMVDPLPAQQPPVEEMIRHAYVDPNDPSQLYLQQPPESRTGLRRRHYNSSAMSSNESH